MRNMKRITVFLCTMTFAMSQANRDEVVQISFPTEGVTVMTDSIDVTFTLASFFDIDTAGCTDCDGYIKVYLNGYYNTSVYAVEAVPITNLYEGSYLVKLEAVDPSGNSFDPAAYDTVNFNVDLPDVDNLCEPTGFSVVGGAARNFLSWNKPVNASSENPFPASPGSADYHSGSTTNTGFTETSLIKGDAGSSSSRQSGWIRFNLAEMIPFVTVDSIIFNYYVNDTNWPYWSVTPVTVDPLDGDPGALHADINTGYGATDAYLYRLEPSGFSAGQYSNVLINGANTDLEAAIQQGYIVMGVVDRDGAGTYHVYLDGWNEANPPSLEIHWSLGDSRGIYQSPAIAEDLPYTDEEIFTYKQTVSSGLEVSEYLMGIRNYEQEPNFRFPNSNRDDIEGCGDLQNYLIYASDGTVLDSVADTTEYIHDNLTNDAEYCYYIVANYTGGESEVSETLCATPAAFIAAAPTNLRGTALDEEAFLVWTEPGTPSYVFFEDFTNGIPADWTIVNLSGDEYTWASPHDNSNAVFSGFGDNLYAICDSDDAPSTIAMDEELITPALDFSSISTPFLQFTTYYNDLTAGDGSDYADVDVSTDGGTTWTNLISWNSDQGSAANPVVETVALDSLAGDSSDVKIRFHYNDNNSWAWYWAIDDIIIYDSDPTADAMASRETDGDFLHYQVITGDSVYVDSVTATNALVTGLTNGQTYTFGVTAKYYPEYKSDTVEVSVTPTWLYGDISGTVYGPDGTTAMDSAVVTVSGMRDTTGSDGVYSFVDLDPGTYTVRASRSGFDRDEADVTVVAQEDAVVRDFIILPILGKAVGLTAIAGDEQVTLEWMSPGAMLPGEWVYYHDGTFENAYASTAGGSGLASLFIPTGYPATIQSVRFHVSDFGTPTDDIEVNIYKTSDTDAPELIAGPYTVPGVSDDFVEVDVEDATIESGGFLVATFNIGTNGPFISVDQDNYNGSLYFGNNTDGWTEMSAFGIFVVGSHEALISAGSGLVNTSEEIPSPSENRNSSANDLSFIQPYNNDEMKEFFLGESGAEHLQAVLNTNPITTSNYRTSREDSLVGFNVYQINTSGDTAISNLGPEDTSLVVTGLTNYTDYCFNVKVIWDTEDFDTLESKYTNEACAKPFKLGDVDFDNDVDVVDIPLIVDFVLGTDSPSDEEFRAADVNDDRTINIQDIVMTVDIIFGTTSSRTLAFDPTAIAAVGLEHSSMGIEVNFDYDGIARGFQFVVDHDPAQITFGQPILTHPNEGLMFQHFDDGDGNYSVVAVQVNSGSMDLSAGKFLTIPIAMTSDAAQNGVEVSLNNLVISGPSGQEIPVSDGGISLKLDVLPTNYSLHQNYPNPFNPETEIRFDLPEKAPVELTIYNLMGQKVRTLVTGDLKSGFHHVSWNGLNDAGHSVSTGLYFYTISAGTYHATKKMLLLK